MKHRILPLSVALSLVAAILIGAGPATQPSSDGGAELTPRQKNLLLQLSDAEANIQAINKALVLTGYKVGLEYNRIDSNLKGNEIMNRKGGGPVRWDEFYGNNDWGDRRPEQFAYVYQANNDQINRAQQNISTLAKNQSGLLARRQKHEQDQSRLWATLAWEQIRNREIALKALCRFALKPEGPEQAVLRPVILFLRTADQIAVQSLDPLATDQAATFDAASQRMAAAYQKLQLSLADALDSPSLKPERLKEAQALKALCKELAEGATVISDNYDNALDRERASQDSSKLEFRAQLQTSLATYSSVVARLHEQVMTTAKAWGVEPDRGAKAPDEVALAAVVMKQKVVTKTVMDSPSAPPAPPDALQPGTIWSGLPPNATRKIKWTVLERIGDRVKMRLEVGTDKEGIVWARVTDGVLSFAGNDVQLIKGQPFHDTHSTIRGDQIEFGDQDDNGKPKYAFKREK